MTKIIPAYLHALLKEIRFVGERVDKGREKVESIYMGGGTPSLLRAQQVAELIVSVADQFDVNVDAEVTLEANPVTTQAMNFTGLIEAGVNRLSFGAQSFVDDELKALGRIHSVDQIHSSVAQARVAGFENISLDLIFGIPGQTIMSWQESLEAALALAPEHLSLYSLILEEGTPLFERVSRGDVRLPESDLVADMYLLARELLAQAGYGHYEISNWAREPRLESAHNKVYWHNDPYHAFGTGAHRRFDNYRSSNVENTIDYISRMVNIQPMEPNWISPASADVLEITPMMSMQETMMLGLRLVREGVSEKVFYERYKRQTGDVFAKEIRHILARGLAEWVVIGNDRCLRLTWQGVMLGNQAFLEFV